MHTIWNYNLTEVLASHGVRKAMADVDTVYHLAALIAIPYSYHSPDTYVDTNIKGTLNIVQAARDLGTRMVVHTSTSEVYGTAKFVPITEDHPLQGQSPYSASKIGADQIAMSFHAAFGTPVSIIRPFNTYGPRQSTRAVIPTIITQLLNNQLSISLGSTSPTRDFNFVRDTVDGFMAVGRADKAVGEVINIGSNYEISIADTARLVAEILEMPMEINLDQHRLRPDKSEVERLWADNRKAKALTGWQPAYAGIEGLKRGLTETIEWFKVKENLKRYKIGNYTI